ncbi:MAG: hypothetical protein HY706_20590 [Candidatus Hydrogenedentes bacterium]|nr:hypothetical protein [Candidatus Hydrogenedentota bacterium]
MKSINLETEKVELGQLLHYAEQEPVLLVTEDGHEFILSEADDFDAEVEALRNSQRFQSFLDTRMAGQGAIPLEQIEKEVEEELKCQEGHV